MSNYGDFACVYDLLTSEIDYGKRAEYFDQVILRHGGFHGILLDSRIRRLTPLEAFRLQGVPDAYFERAASVCSDAQLYRQIGNAVTVPVVQAIGEKLAEDWKGENEYDSSYFLQQASL